MLKFLAASILMLSLVDIGVAHGEHVQQVVGVIAHFFHYALHMGSGSLFTW